MKQIATGRLAQVAGRYAEHTPAATACCNACRTCVQTNLIVLGTGGILAAAAAVQRIVARPSLLERLQAALKRRGKSKTKERDAAAAVGGIVAGSAGAAAPPTHGHSA